MLKITIPKAESFDEGTSEFVVYPEVVLSLEHSLFTLSKWESKWEKPYLGREPKTDEQTLDYIRCMSHEPIPDQTLLRLTNENFSEIGAYIEASMTATWFNDKNAKPSREIITAELIYYWMIQSNIPFECEHWHLNKLMTLIKVCSAKNAPPQKMSRQEAAKKQRAINEANRAKFNTSG